MTSASEMVRQIIARILRQPPESLRGEDKLSLLGMDSIDRALLATMIEEELGRSFPDEALANVKTVADVQACVEELSLPRAAESGPPGQAPESLVPEQTLISSLPVANAQFPAEEHGAPPREALHELRVGVSIHDTADVHASAKVGARTRIWHQAQIGPETVIGEDCVLGKGVYVSSGAIVGHRVKIQNGCGIYGARLEDEVMLAPGVYLLEDPLPRAATLEGKPKARGDWTRKPVTIKHGATVGANAVVAPGVTIGSCAMITIGAVVNRDVLAHALVAGNPARQVGWVCRCGAQLDDNLRCAICGITHFRAPDGLVPGAEPP